MKQVVFIIALYVLINILSLLFYTEASQVNIYQLACL